MNRLTVRCGGMFAFSVFILLLSGVLPIYLSISSAIKYGPMLIHAAGVVLGLFIGVVAVAILLRIKIVVTNSELIIWTPTNKLKFYDYFIPNSSKVAFRIEEIRQIDIAIINKLERIAKELNNTTVINALEGYRTIFALHTGLPTPVAPMMLIQAKSGAAYVVFLKPFSRKAIKNLVKILIGKGVQVNVDKWTGLST